MNTSLFNRIISVTEFRRNFGELTAHLPEVDSLILTKGGKPFAIIKAVPAEKRKMLKSTAGTWKKTPLDRDALWRDVFKRKSRTFPISL